MRARFEEIWRFIFEIEPGRETFKEWEKASKIEKVLWSLNKIRESPAEDSFLEQPGQLLDKALVKQIAIREAELDSLVAPNNASVIGRCTIPDPEATCFKSNPDSHILDKVPKDFSIILNYFF